MGRYPHTDRWFESDEDRAAVEQAMRRTDCWDLRDRLVQTLSGGERQRVLLAACLAQPPRLLLLDEPSTYLDVDQQLQCFSLLREESRARRRVPGGDARPESRADVRTRLIVLAQRASCARRAGRGGRARRRIGCGLFSPRLTLSTTAVGQAVGRVPVTSKSPAHADRWVWRLRGGVLRRCVAAAVRRSVPLDLARVRARAGAGLVDPRSTAAVADAARALRRRRALARRQPVSVDAARCAGDAVHARRLDRRIARRRHRDLARLAADRRHAGDLGRGARRRRHRARARGRRALCGSGASRRSAFCSPASRSTASVGAHPRHPRSGRPDQSFSISRWLIGSLDSVDYPTLAAFAAVVALSRRRRHAPGAAVESAGRGSVVGRDARRRRRSRSTLSGYVAGSLLAAATVALTGPIGFVGLVVPHLIRTRVGADDRVLMPCAFLRGGVLLADVRRDRPRRPRAGGGSGRRDHGIHRRTVSRLAAAAEVGALMTRAPALRRRHVVERRQELDGDGDLRVAARARRLRRAVQGAEHVEQLVSLPRRRRDRPRAGGAGRGVRARAGAGDEPDPAEAERQRHEPGRRQRPRVEDAVRARVLRARRRAASRTCSTRTRISSRRFDVVVIEGAGSVTELNLREHDLVNLGLVTRDPRAVAARRRHRARRRVRVGRRHGRTC